MKQMEIATMAAQKNNYRYSNVFIEPNHQAIMHLLAKNIKTKYKIKTNT
jgi:hypothetical protein